MSAADSFTNTSTADAGKADQAAEQRQDAVTLKQLERGHIVRILQRTHWRIEGAQGAAAILGMNPSTLRSRMHKLGIERSERTLTPKET